jgi:hypothetical protein
MNEKKPSKFEKMFEWINWHSEDIGILLKLIGIAVFVGIVLFWGLPAFNARVVQLAEDNKVVSNFAYSYNGTVSMVEYRYSWFGLGGIESTTIRFEEPALINPNSTVYSPYFQSLFKLSGYLQVQSGLNYSLTYHVITHGDGDFEVMPDWITQISVLTHQSSEAKMP